MNTCEWRGRKRGDAWKGIGKREGKRGGMLAVFTIHQSQSNAFRCWFAVNVIIPFIKFHYHWPWHGLPQLRLASWFGRVSKPIREASGTAVCPRAWFESLSSEIECNDNTLVNSVPIPFPIHVRAILATITRYSFFIPVFFRTPHFPLPFHQIIPTSHAWRILNLLLYLALDIDWNGSPSRRTKCQLTISF